MREGLFQSIEFLNFIRETGFLEPFRFTVSREGNEVGVIQGFIQKEGGCLKRFFSRRAIVNGGPWLAANIPSADFETLLKNCIAELKHKAIYIETRNYADYSNWREVFEKTGFRYEPHYDYQIDLSDPDAWEGRMESSRRRFVKSSLKQGATIVDDPDNEEITGFYEVLKDLYNNRIKKPLFPLSFFLQLQNESFCKYLLIKYEKEIIGGILCIYDEDAAYEWFVCGKDGCYPKIYPSTLATWAAIRFAADNGCKCFDMMGAGAPGDGGYGVREFKAKFGGELKEFGRFKYIAHPFLYKIGSLGVKLMKRL